MKLFMLWIVLLTITLSQNCVAEAKSETGIDKQILSITENIDKNSLDIVNINEDIRKNKQKIWFNKFINKEANSKITDVSNLQTELFLKLERNTAHTSRNTNSLQIQKKSINNHQLVISSYKSDSNKQKQEIADLNRALNKLHAISGLTSDYLDRFWVLIAAVLVFFMQAGFKTFEAGMVRKEHEDNVAIKNVLDWLNYQPDIFYCRIWHYVW